MSFPNWISQANAGFFQSRPKPRKGCDRSGGRLFSALVAEKLPVLEMMSATMGNSPIVGPAPRMTDNDTPPKAVDLGTLSRTSPLVYPRYDENTKRDSDTLLNLPGKDTTDWFKVQVQGRGQFNVVVDQISGGNVALEVYNDTLRIGTSDHTNSSAESFSRVVNPGTYFILAKKVSGSSPQYALSVALDTGLSSGVVTVNGEPSAKQLRLRRTDGQPIREGVKTSVVIHGRNDTAGGLSSIVDGMQGSVRSTQVLTLDWSHDGTKGKWIEEVGIWLGRSLRDMQATQVSLIGHSWGSYVAYQAARGRTADLLIALDSPRDTIEGYDSSGINFAAVSNESVAFHTSSFGSVNKALTAKIAIRTEVVSGFPNPFEDHNAAKPLLGALLAGAGANPDAPLYRLFKWERLMGRTLNIKKDGLSRGYEMYMEVAKDDEGRVVPTLVQYHNGRNLVRETASPPSIRSFLDSNLGELDTRKVDTFFAWENRSRTSTGRVSTAGNFQFRISDSDNVVLQVFDSRNVLIATVLSGGSTTVNMPVGTYRVETRTLSTAIDVPFTLDIARL